MLKAFISQPMKDKSDERIKAEREVATQRIKAMIPNGDIEIIDSFFEDAPHEAHPLWFLSESIKLLGEADIVYFCKDWEKYNGCTIEHECAVRYGKLISYE